MKNDEKAKIILEELSKFVELDKDSEKWYLYGIKNGLNEIEKQEIDIKKANDFAESQAK